MRYTMKPTTRERRTMKDTRSRPERAGINIKMRPELRARANACAKLEGLAVPEFVRAAIVAHCERSEKLHGQRSRAQAAAGAQREGG